MRLQHSFVDCLYFDIDHILSSSTKQHYHGNDNKLVIRQSIQIILFNDFKLAL